jgi:antirestriction protein ArdC
MSLFDTYGGDKEGVFKSLYERLEKAVQNDEKLTWDSLLGRNGFHNAHSGRTYTGFVNNFILSIAALGNGGDPRFVTFAGCKAMGGWVNKGAKFIPIWRPVTAPKKIEKDGREETIQVFTGRFAPIQVLHVSQTTLVAKGLIPADWAEKNPEAKPDVLDWFELIPASKEEGRDPRPYYCSGTDKIHVPPYEQFKSSFGFAEAYAHELIHWTLAPSRCNRDTAGQVSNREAYSFEELVACIGSSFILSHLGIDLGEKEIDRQTAYLKTWLGRLKMDMGLLFEAATKASEAANFLIKTAKETLKERGVEVAEPEVETAETVAA